MNDSLNRCFHYVQPQKQKLHRQSNCNTAIRKPKSFVLYNFVHFLAGQRMSNKYLTSLFHLKAIWFTLDYLSINQAIFKTEVIFEGQLKHCILRTKLLFLKILPADSINQRTTKVVKISSASSNLHKEQFSFLPFFFLIQNTLINSFNRQFHI